MRRTVQRQNLRDSGNDGKAAGAGTLNGGAKGWGQGRKQEQEQEQELKYKMDMKGMNVIYWLLYRFGVAKDVVEDENEVCIDYLKGYGWMKPHSSIPSERFPVEERTKERLEWMKENDVKIV